MWKRELRGRERIVGLLAIIGEARIAVNPAPPAPKSRNSEKRRLGAADLRFLVGSKLQTLEIPSKLPVCSLVYELLYFWVFEDQGLRHGDS
jgi:hypothetical protein